MSTITAFSPAKINLRLDVVGLRPDGYHELAMVMQSVNLCDEISFTRHHGNEVTLVTDCPSLPVDSSNLIVKAATLLRENCSKELPGVKIHLKKRIPVGAGLAGGSSNAAATLLALNNFWHLRLSQGSLLELSARLGCDVPFCLTGGTQLCFGRGEVLESLPFLGSGSILLLKGASASVSTPWAFKLCRQQLGGRYLSGAEAFNTQRGVFRESELVRAIKSNDLHRVGQCVGNDILDVVRPERAAVEDGLRMLTSAPSVLGCGMTGTGPTVFGLFANREQAMAAKKHCLSLPGAGQFDSWVCDFLNRGAYISS